MYKNSGLEYLYSMLESEIERLANALRGCSSREDKATLVTRIDQVRFGARLLKKCEEFGVLPNSDFTRLPQQTCQTPSSEYRVMEDIESDERRYWVEATKEGGRQLRLQQGDVVIEL